MRLRRRKDIVSAITIHPMTVRDRQFEVTLTYDGKFQARLDGKLYTDITRNGLHAQLVRATKRKTASISIPFEIMDEDGTVRRGEATGLHISAGLILVRWEDGSTGSESSLHGAVRPLIDDERTLWVRLKRETQLADEALREFMRGKSIDVGSLVSQEIKRAMSA